MKRVLGTIFTYITTILKKISKILIYTVIVSFVVFAAILCYNIVVLDEPDNTEYTTSSNNENQNSDLPKSHTGLFDAIVAYENLFNAIEEITEAANSMEITSIEDLNVSEETKVKLDSLIKSVKARQEREAKEAKAASALKESTAEDAKVTDKTKVAPSAM